WTALAVVFLDMLRYMDALEIYKVRAQMRSKLRSSQRTARALREAVQDLEGQADDSAVSQRLRSMEDAMEPSGSDLEDENQVVGDNPNLKLQQEFNRRFPWYARIRNVLMAGRIRPHLISGIEFQMGVFIIAPIVAAAVPGAVIPIVAVSGAGLLAFALVIIYKFWLSTRDYSKSFTAVPAIIGEHRAALPEGQERTVGNRTCPGATRPERSSVAPGLRGAPSALGARREARRPRGGRPRGDRPAAGAVSAPAQQA